MILNRSANKRDLNYKETIKHLANRRIELGLTQKQLGAMTGKSGQSISNIECCLYCPFPKTVEKLISALQIGEPEATQIKTTLKQYRIDNRNQRRQA